MPGRIREQPQDIPTWKIIFECDPIRLWVGNYLKMFFHSNPNRPEYAGALSF